MPEEAPRSLQETYASESVFGCGSANEKGLHIRSLPDGDEVVLPGAPSAITRPSKVFSMAA